MTAVQIRVLPTTNVEVSQGLDEGRGQLMEITRDGGTLLLSGDFDVRSTWEVRNALYELLDGHDADVVVDLSEVSSIDLTALRVLAVATRSAARGGRHLSLRGCCPPELRLKHNAHQAHTQHVERPAATA